MKKQLKNIIAFILIFCICVSFTIVCSAETTIVIAGKETPVHHTAPPPHNSNQTNISAIQPDDPIVIYNSNQKETILDYANSVVMLPNGDRLVLIDTNTLPSEYVVENTSTNTTVQEETETKKVDDIPESAVINNELAKEIFELTNKERVANGLKELAYNPKLQDAADVRAKEITENFSHTRPDGTSCHTIVEDWDYNVTGENLIQADTPIATAENLMKSWMDSPGHRANILLDAFTSIAIGIAEKDGVTYATQIFMG